MQIDGQRRRGRNAITVVYRVGEDLLVRDCRHIHPCLQTVGIRTIIRHRQGAIVTVNCDAASGYCATVAGGDTAITVEGPGFGTARGSMSGDGV